MPASSVRIPVPDGLPVRISPCPIVEAVCELRFAASEPWSTLPGLLYAAIRERFPEKHDLPLSQVPEEVRRQDARLGTQPLIRFAGEEPYAVLCGPRMAALVTQADRYPGWQNVEATLGWLLPKLLAVGVVHEPERLGVRYIDFFVGDLFPHLRLGAAVDGQPLSGGELQVVTTFGQWAPFATRVFVSNGASMTASDGLARRGSVLDVDVGLDALELELDEGKLLDRFGEAHQILKQAFFGLLAPAFLATLNPEYGHDANP